MVKEARVLHVITSSLLALSGILLLIWPDLGLTAFRYLLGADFLVLGAVRVLAYFANDLYRLAFQHDLALGGFCLIFGVLMIVSPARMQIVFPYIVGAYILIDALFKLQTALDAKAFGMKHWWGLMLSALTLAGLAIALMVLAADRTANWVLPCTVLFCGIEGVWNTLGTVRVRAKKEGRFEDLVEPRDKKAP